MKAFFLGFTLMVVTVLFVGLLLLLTGCEAVPDSVVRPWETPAPDLYKITLTGETLHVAPALKIPVDGYVVIGTDDDMLTAFGLNGRSIVNELDIVILIIGWDGFKRVDKGESVYLERQP